jgi:hypothetical protein
VTLTELLLEDLRSRLTFTACRYDRPHLLVVFLTLVSLTSLLTHRLTSITIYKSYYGNDFSDGFRHIGAHGCPNIHDTTSTRSCSHLAPCLREEATDGAFLLYSTANEPSSAVIQGTSGLTTQLRFPAAHTSSVESQPIRHPVHLTRYSSCYPLRPCENVDPTPGSLHHEQGCTTMATFSSSLHPLPYFSQIILY